MIDAIMIVALCGSWFLIGYAFGRSHQRRHHWHDEERRQHGD